MFDHFPGPILYWNIIKHNFHRFFLHIILLFGYRKWSGCVIFLLGCLLAPWIHSPAVLWKPSSFACTHLFLLFLSYSLNLPLIWRYFYFVLEGLSNKCYPLQLLFTIFLGNSFHLVNYTCMQCAGLGGGCWSGISQFVWFSPSFPYFQWVPITIQCLNVKRFCLVISHTFAFEPSLFCCCFFCPFSPPFLKISLSHGR